MKYDGKYAKANKDKTVSVTRNRKYAIGTFVGEPFNTIDGLTILVNDNKPGSFIQCKLKPK